MLPTTKLRNNHKGVTLVEVIAVIAVLSVVMAAVVGFMISGARMSAKVSGGATAGMREQTAVEFINQRLWEVDASALEAVPELDEYGNKTGQCLTLKIIKNGVVSTLQSSDGKVTYNTVELCDGDITFDEIKGNTITYTLNGVKHVVHLRITASDNDADQNGT